MTAHPLWFGPSDRPLFGWFHVPDGGSARGGVVLCPTIGLEAANAHVTFRRLAEQLADLGLAALRFDYDGTGDSAGEFEDDDRVGAWLRSVRTAVEWVRSTGVSRVAVVGMRIGATLASVEADAGGGFDDLVLWDPCADGRRFLREQRALWSLIIGGDTVGDGSIETLGLVYPPDVVSSLSSLAVEGTKGTLAGRVLVLLREGRRGERGMMARLEMPHVTTEYVAGQEQLVDVEPFASKVPEETVVRVASWLSDAAGSEVAMVTVPERAAAVVGLDEAGRSVTERAVALGPLGLFGVMTEREGATDGPFVVCFNAGKIDHVGPSRLWVTMARRWATAGLRVLRFDLSGIGDSPVRQGQPTEVVYPPEGFEDIREVLADVSTDDHTNAILVGLCSGGYHAVEGAIAQRVREVCVVNPILTFKPPEVRLTEDRGERVDPRRQASGSTKRWARLLPGHDLLGSLIDRLPDSAWWLINRIAVEAPPARTFERLVQAGTDVFVVAGGHEAHLLTRGESATVRRLRATGRFRLDVVPGLEHTLFEAKGRERVTSAVVDHILSRYCD